jgi:hypothetical protein
MLLHVIISCAQWLEYWLWYDLIATVWSARYTTRPLNYRPNIWNYMCFRSSMWIYHPSFVIPSTINWFCLHIKFKRKWSDTWFVDGPKRGVEAFEWGETMPASPGTYIHADAARVMSVGPPWAWLQHPGHGYDFLGMCWCFIHVEKCYADDVVNLRYASISWCLWSIWDSPLLRRIMYRVG